MKRYHIRYGEEDLEVSENGEWVRYDELEKAPDFIDVTFEGESPNLLFVDVHNSEGKSINVGEWQKTDEDGFTALRIPSVIELKEKPDNARVFKVYSDDKIIILRIEDRVVVNSVSGRHRTNEPNAVEIDPRETEARMLLGYAGFTVPGFSHREGGVITHSFPHEVTIEEQRALDYLCSEGQYTFKNQPYLTWPPVHE